MIRRLELRSEADISAILRVQRLSYAVEAKLIGFDGIPPLADDENSLKNCDETFWGFFNTRNELAAVIAYLRNDRTLDICRLVVSPEYFKNGYATPMLEFIEQEEQGIKEIIVSTAEANTPALNLYCKLGYKRVGSKVVKESLEIVSLQKKVE